MSKRFTNAEPPSRRRGPRELHHSRPAVVTPLIRLLDRLWRHGLIAVIGLVAGLTPCTAAEDPPTMAELRQTICRTVDAAAVATHLPPAFLTRVLWQESHFHPEVTSRAGAQGVAQFMPKTAAERGLRDPRQVDLAIVYAARLLADLTIRFGNYGLAAAAYNAGTARTTKWLHAESALAPETRQYVVAVTGRTPEEWVGMNGSRIAIEDRRLCLQVLADLPGATSTRQADWVARLDRRFAEAVAKLGRQGTMSARSNREAEVLCNTIRSLGARCAVY